jgi:hypothetical protein
MEVAMARRLAGGLIIAAKYNGCVIAGGEIV